MSDELETASTDGGVARAPDPQAPRWDGSRSPRQAATITAAVGIAFAVLFLLGYALLAGLVNTETDISGDVAQRRIRIVGLYVMPFAGIAFIWFSVALRMWISLSTRRVDQLLSNVQLVAAILFVALFFVAGASWAAAAAGAEFSSDGVNVPSVRELPSLGSTVLFVFAMRMAAMFVFTTTSIASNAKVLPRWFAYLGYIVGAFLLLSVSFAQVLVLVFPLWVLALGLFLFRWGRRLPNVVPASAASPPEPIAGARGE